MNYSEMIGRVSDILCMGHKLYKSPTLGNDVFVPDMWLKYCTIETRGMVVEVETNISLAVILF